MVKSGESMLEIGKSKKQIVEGVYNNLVGKN